MRTFFRRSIVLVACLGTALVWSGCSSKKATEYVTGISTQVEVPRDLKAIRIDALVGGVPQWCQAYKVFDGKVRLPGSLGSYAATDAAATGGSITYTIAGVADDEIAKEVFADCSKQTRVGEDSVRILRRSIQPYVRDEIRFLPMPLKYSCFDKACKDDETCKGGRCVSATLTPDQIAALPKYSPDLVDGTAGGCFSVQLCMGAAQPALVVDPDTCTYAVAASASAPATIDPDADPFHHPCTTASECPSNSCNNGHCDALPPNTPWEGTNVEVVYDGGLTREILDLDVDEGFVFANDPANPQRFKLAPGLCDMVKGTDVNPSGKEVGEDCKVGSDCKSDVCRLVPDASDPTNESKAKYKCLSRHRITAVRAAGTCKPKRLAQPFCAADARSRMGLDENGNPSNIAPPNDCTTVELKPARSALMLVVDDTQGHSAFFNADEIAAVSFPLSDPAFERTDIGLMYTPTPDGAGCSSAAAPTVDLAPARTVSGNIIANLTQLASNPSALSSAAPSLEGALASSYARLGKLNSNEYFKRAVILVGNREFDNESCNAITGTPSQQALAARTADPTKSISTYVIQLVKRDPNVSVEADTADPGLQPLVAAGSTEPYNADSRGKNSKNAKDIFQKVINSLATCTYDVPDFTAPTSQDIVSYSDPVFGGTTKIAPNAACTGEGVPGDGWGYGPSPSPSTKRIFLCSNSCSAYRNVLEQASNFALLYKKTPLAVPIFAHKSACEPTDAKKK